MVTEDSFFGGVVRRQNPSNSQQTSATSHLKMLFAQDADAYPIDQNVLSVHPCSFGTCQESHNGRDVIDRSDALRWVGVRNGRDELLWLAVSEQCSVDRA